MEPASFFFWDSHPTRASFPPTTAIRAPLLHLEKGTFPLLVPLSPPSLENLLPVFLPNRSTSGPNSPAGGEFHLDAPPGL